MVNRSAMVVDDSLAMRTILGEQLQSLGFSVDAANDGEQAMSRLGARQADLPPLILVDWNMPIMNGLDFIRHVRSRCEYQGIKLLVVTSEAGMREMGIALDAGADEYLMKPFSVEALASKLQLLGLV